ncbi:SIMPL domain-containing protein [Sphingomonas gellani]
MAMMRAMALTTPLVLTAAAVLLPGVASAQTAPSSVEPMVPASGTVLDVTAEGRTTRVPDLATIRAGVVTQSATAAAALSDNAARMSKVLAALRGAGVAPRDIATSNVNLSPQYRYAENQPPVVTGYQATNSVSIRFRDIAKSGRILDALVAQGANQIDGPNLSIDDPDAALDEARGDAVKRAQARAALYARAAGLSVVRIVSITEAGQDAGGPERPPVVFSARAMAAPAPQTDIVPGEKQVGVTLSVRFLLR